MKKVAFVTGASSGIGAATALRLNDAGYQVYAAARRVERMASLEAAGIHVLSLDLTDPDSITAAVRTVLADGGRLDLLVNNAGYGSYGAIEDVPMAEARAQFEVNVFGLADLTRQVMPQMRAQRGGTIANISSMGGKVVAPLGGWYHASKFALEALSDALRMEARPFGIHVVVIEPGSVRSEWGRVAAEHLRSTARTSPYRAVAERVADHLAASSEPGSRTTSEPEVIARTVVRVARATRPRTRYRTGFGAAPLVFLRWLLPDRAIDSLVRRSFGVHQAPIPTADGPKTDNQDLETERG
ncbi:oxidoreductase [Streptomyces sp. NPDC048290]|uniref:oxidoreductase n=1 Tax=Streptomyces sp. NPDC048290 TaxID=3155811 RepID=UPI00344281E1